MVSAFAIIRDRRRDCKKNFVIIGTNDVCVCEHCFRYIGCRPANIGSWFGDSRLIPHKDARIEVIAKTDDLWQAGQLLLSYHEHCEVLGPPELVEMMRESVSRMSQVYAMNGADQ